ncbi:hypothetical protein [Lewinella sp. 4G2]|uniref:hypothetical protein n=1 Tax=Lewinella sp. 4G2 TaxID=1803372 RepID=UPI0007B45DC2|nr:hypothetical protein [Lewinella sp. 4G2]OAV42635.1 hypothetical protein A3850_015425 [Lewinella sp. 4G2]
MLLTEKSNKLLSLISQLDKPRIKACRKLLRSPWFGGNQNLEDLFVAIAKLVKAGKPVDKQQVWQQVFGPEKAYNDVRFRKFSSDLFKLVREFYLQEALAQEPHLRDYLYLSALEKDQPEKLVRSVERNWAQLKESGERYEVDTYLYDHLLEKRKYTLLNYRHRPFDHTNMEAISGALDSYFIITKLMHAAYAQVRLQTEQTTYDLQLVPEIITYLEEHPRYLQEPLIALYFFMYKMLDVQNSEEANDHKLYEQYIETIKLHGDHLPLERGYEFIQPALNYSRRYINRGDAKFLGEYLRLYQYALDREFVFDRGVLDPLQFRNTILTALRLGEFEWAERYITDYQHRLPAKQRQNAVTYNSATLYFYQKDYDRALEFLRDVEYENTTYNLNAKSMLLAIYYETETFDALDSLFDAINSYLHRHKELPESAVKAFGNLVSFTLRLTRLLPDDKRSLEVLKADFAGKKYIASRPWLAEKIAAFEEKR